MSIEPRRLIDEGPDELRELLQSAQLDEPTESQLASLTTRVSFLFPIIPGGGGGGGGSGGGGSHGPTAGGRGTAAGAGAVKAAASLGAAKVTAMVVAATVAASGGYAMLRSAPTPAPVTSQPLKAQPEVTPEQPPEPVAAPEVAVQPEPAPRPRVAQERPPAPPASEDELLQRAMQLARAGNPSAALAEANQHATRFPTSVMAQEREVVAITALVELGRREEAQRRAVIFKAKWPTSAHVTQIDTLTQQR